jgi:hypothetical protein
VVPAGKQGAGALDQFEAVKKAREDLGAAIKQDVIRMRDKAMQDFGLEKEFAEMAIDFFTNIYIKRANGFTD